MLIKYKVAMPYRALLNLMFPSTKETKVKPQKEKYAIDEVNSIFHTTVIGLNKKYTTPGKELLPAERKHLLEEGVVPLKKGVAEVWGTDKVHHVFDFSQYENAPVKDQGKIEANVDTLRSVYIGIKDTVALGDEDTALSLLKEFRDYCNQILKG